jgi:hypothetical protein
MWYNPALGAICLCPPPSRMHAFIRHFSMTKIFYDFEDVFVYIDNIILFTKSTFEHHVQHLSTVLDCLQANNLHVHIEETFLATQEVDYLGNILSTKGIKPQKKKILAILAFAEPKNKFQL